MVTREPSETAHCVYNRRSGVGGAGGAGAWRGGALLGGARRAAATGARGAAASNDGARFREIQPEYQCVNGDTPNPLIWGSGTPFTAEQQESNAYLRQKETERAAAVLLLYPDV